MTLDKNDIPHIIFSDGRELEYLTKVDGIWSYENIILRNPNLQYLPEEIQQIAIKIDEDNNLVVVFYGGVRKFLKYAIKNQKSRKWELK